MNKHVTALTRDMAQSEALKAVEMDDARVAQIQIACSAVEQFADWYRATPRHPAIADYRAARLAQFMEALSDLKGIIND